MFMACVGHIQLRRFRVVVSLSGKVKCDFAINCQLDLRKIYVTIIKLKDDYNSDGNLTPSLSLSQRERDRQKTDRQVCAHTHTHNHSDTLQSREKLWKYPSAELKINLNQTAVLNAGLSQYYISISVARIENILRKPNLTNGVMRKKSTTHVIYWKHVPQPTTYKRNVVKTYIEVRSVKHNRITL